MKFIDWFYGLVGLLVAFVIYLGVIRPILRDKNGVYRKEIDAALLKDETYPLKIGRCVFW